MWVWIRRLGVVLESSAIIVLSNGSKQAFASTPVGGREARGASVSQCCLWQTGICLRPSLKEAGDWNHSIKSKQLLLLHP